MAEKPKTDAQRNSLHKWLELLAVELNNAGLDMKTVLREEVEIPWTKQSAKEHLYKPILKIMQDKDSTEDMNTVEPGEVARVVGRHLADKFGITPPEWPSRYRQ